MRRLGTVLLAPLLLLAACGGDDGPSAADDREAANQSIAAFEAAAGDEGFEVDPDEDDDDDELEFESDECQALEAVLGDDDDVEGQTADVDSDDFVRSDGEFEETLSASLVIADADALADELTALDADLFGDCVEEAMTLSFEELAEGEGQPAIEARDFSVDVDRPDLGEEALRLRATGTIAIEVLEIPMYMEILLVQDGRRGATASYTAIGLEPDVDLEPFIDVLLDPPAAA